MSGGTCLETHDPFTGERVASVPLASPLEVEGAVRRARDAQPGWAALPLDERLLRLDRWRQLLYRDRQALATLVRRETGKADAEVLTAEVVTALDLIRFYVRAAPGLLRSRTTSSSTLALIRKRIETSWEPWGVAAVISPWNYPVMLPVGQLAPLLAAGNAVVHKPSDLTAGTAAFLHERLVEAGIPAEVAACVQGGVEVGQALVASTIDKVFFTGSVRAGRHVAASCAGRLIPCSLELGGSDPAIVLADADIRTAARGIAWGRFSNAGQTCVAAKRVIVHERVADHFLASLRQEIGRLHLRTADQEAWDVGPLARRAAVAELDAMVRDDMARGARVEHPAGLSPHAGVYPPTLLLELPRDARCLREETFGPVLPIVRVPSVEEAVRAANDTDYGLSASVWSADRSHARAVASRLRVGTVVINDVVLVAGIAEASHGGLGASGSGRSHGVAGLMEAVRSRTMVDDLLPRRAQPWWFPYSARRAAEIDAYIQLAHAPRWYQRLRGILPSLRLFLRG